MSWIIWQKTLLFNPVVQKMTSLFGIYSIYWPFENIFGPNCRRNAGTSTFKAQVWSPVGSSNETLAMVNESNMSCRIYIGVHWVLPVSTYRRGPIIAFAVFLLPLGDVQCICISGFWNGCPPWRVMLNGSLRRLCGMLHYSLVKLSPRAKVITVPSE